MILVQTPRVATTGGASLGSAAVAKFFAGSVVLLRAIALRPLKSGRNGMKESWKRSGLTVAAAVIAGALGAETVSAAQSAQYRDIDAEDQPVEAAPIWDPETMTGPDYYPDAEFPHLPRHSMSQETKQSQEWS